MALDMSSEELRAHLFRSLQERGVLDSLKVGQSADTTPTAEYTAVYCSVALPRTHTHTHTHTHCTVSVAQQAGY